MSPTSNTLLHSCASPNVTSLVTLRLLDTAVLKIRSFRALNPTSSTFCFLYRSEARMRHVYLTHIHRFANNLRLYTHLRATYPQTTLNFGLYTHPPSKLGVALECSRLLRFHLAQFATHNAPPCQASETAPCATTRRRPRNSPSRQLLPLSRPCLPSPTKRRPRIWWRLMFTASNPPSTSSAVQVPLSSRKKTTRAHLATQSPRKVCEQFTHAMSAYVTKECRVMTLRLSSRL